MSATKKQDLNWDFILDTIDSERCILFVGPEIFSEDNGGKLEDALASHLKIKSNPDIHAYYPDDGLFLFTSDGKKTTSYYAIKRFYNQSFPKAEALMEKIAEIPFHFIISITPSEKLREVFKNKGINARFGFYKRHEAANNVVKTPTKSFPLIYNLFGTVEEQESMVLTHDDLFDYLASIFKRESMPENLKMNLRNVHNFIFLGMDLEKWYMQLLLRILYQINKNYSEKMRYAANHSMDEQVKTFCFEQFNIEFVPDEIGHFMGELHRRCAESGRLRQNQDKKDSVVREMIKQLPVDGFEVVIEKFIDFLEEAGDKAAEKISTAIHLQFRHKRNQKKFNKGTISPTDADVEFNKINEALLDLMQEARAFE